MHAGRRQRFVYVCDDDDVARALREAAAAGNLRRVTEMLAKGVSVDATDLLQVRAIHMAVAHCHLEMVKLLIAHGCDVNVQSALRTAFEEEPGTKQFMSRHLPLRILVANYNEDSFGISPLHLAASRRRLNIVKALVSANANVNAEDTLKETPLFSAVAYGSDNVAAFLIQKGAAVNVRNLDGLTPLHLAVECGTVYATKLLIQNKAAINAENLQGLTALHVSIRNGRAAISQFLIDSGADVNATDNEGRTPLHTAARSGCSSETARLLITKGSSVNARDKCGRTPLHLAAENDYGDIVYILIQNKADVNVTDDLMWTTLHSAAYKGNLDIVNSLYLLKAKIDSRTHEQATPLHLAADRCHADVVNSLLSLGAEVNAADHTNWTALHFAADESSTRHNMGQSQDSKLNTMKVLIERGADVNAKGNCDETALHVAVKYGDRVAARYLLENGAYYDVKTNSYFGSSTVLEMAAIASNVGVNALLRATEKLFQAVKNGDCAEIEKCLKEGAPVNSRSIRHESPLLFSSWKGLFAVVRVLLQNGADVNLSNSDGDTPLHYAAKFGNYEILCALLQHGAVYNTRTKTGNKTPLHFAQEEGKKVVVDILELIERMFNRVSIEDNTVLKELNELKGKKYGEFLAIKNCKNEHKESLTQIASKNGYEELCQMFCEL